MKKYSCFLLLITLFACRKEAAPVASSNVANPFARVDNAGNEVDHQIYLLYQQTGIPVLYTDTLTTNPVVKLKIGYHITSIDSFVAVTYLHAAEDKLAGVNFIKDDILPSLGGSLKPYSVLLADTLFTYQYVYGVKTKIVLNAYSGLQTLVIGRITELKTMTADDIKVYKKDIFKNILLIQLNQQDKLLAPFYAVSAAFYNQYVYGDGSYGYLPSKPKGEYGLIAIGQEYDSYPVGDQTEDLNNYLDVMLVLSADEFAQKYGSYPLVMTKYALLKQALTSLEFKF